MIWGAFHAKLYGQAALNDINPNWLTDTLATLTVAVRDSPGLFYDFSSLMLSGMFGVSHRGVVTSLANIAVLGLTSCLGCTISCSLKYG